VYFGADSTTTTTTTLTTTTTTLLKPNIIVSGWPTPQIARKS